MIPTPAIRGVLPRATTRTHQAAFATCARASSQGRSANKAFRTSPGVTPVKGEPRDHPGYTSYETPVTSSHPKDMPRAPQGVTPASQTKEASTTAGPRHSDVETMAKGTESQQGGSGAVEPQ